VPESNWLPAPSGTFSLYIRAYWAEKAILDVLRVSTSVCAARIFLGGVSG